MNEKQNSGNNRHSLKLVINGKHYEWNQQYITGAQVRELGSIPGGSELFLAIKRPWEDEAVGDDSKIDLARPGIEHFYSKHNDHHLVIIKINRSEYKVERGKYTVLELKKIGKVPTDHVLFEIFEGKIGPPLSDAEVLNIKGGEIFSSGPRGGASS